MLSIDNMYLKRGSALCVRNVNATLKPGTFTAIVGPNGAGKSSLLKGLCAQWPLEEGVVQFCNQDISTMNQKVRAKKMAVMPQKQTMSFDFTVRELVSFGRAPFIDQPRSHNEAIVDFCVKTLSLTPLANRGILSLSGGELQRVYLAKAIAQLCDKPGQLPGHEKVLLLDEPTSALDMAQQVLAMEVLSHIAKNGGTVVAVMHDLNLVSCFADDILLMQEGKLVSHGSAEKLLQADTLGKVFGCHIAVDKRASDNKSIMSVSGSLM